MKKEVTPIITLFTSPKPFRGQIALIQRNAIKSWTLLSPKPEIIIFGKEEGAIEVAQEFNLRHISQVACNEFGTPLVNDIFQRAQQLATYDLLCYINADIIATQGLLQAINVVQKQMQRFVMICSTWDVVIENQIDFSSSDWQGQLYDLARENGRPPLSIGVDLFLFPRGFYQHIPPFAIGRIVFDNWLIFEARREKIPLIDSSKFVFLVHPEHEGTTHGKGRYSYTKETLINKRLISAWARSYIGLDANYILREDGQLRKKGFWELLKPRIQAIESFFPVNRLTQVLYYFKNRLGLSD